MQLVVSSHIRCLPAHGGCGQLRQGSRWA